MTISSVPFLPAQIIRAEAKNKITNQDQVKSMDLKAIAEMESLLSIADDSLATLEGTSGDIDIYMLIASHQKSITASMVSQNPEDEISKALASSLESYSKQLQDIEAWTKGGTAVIGPALDILLENILASADGDFSYCDLQDVFQLILIHMITFPEQYPGIEEIGKDPVALEAMSDLLQFTGSGGHKPPQKYGKGEDSVEELMKAYEYLYPQLKTLAPEGTFAYQCFEIIEDNGGLDMLVEGVSPEEYWTDPDGWNYSEHGNSTPPNGEAATRLNPFRTFSLLNILLDDRTIEMTPEQWEIILSGNIADINELVFELTAGNFDDYFAYMDATSSDWGYGSGGEDFLGRLIPLDYFVDLFNEFPSRELTEDELTEVNRIGDQVKILQQTLKYWLQIVRDEKMAMARNI